jgi:alginate O-acetyltransferase complex protein AlgI
MTEAFSYIGGMFGAGGVPMISAEAVYYWSSNLVVLFIAVIGATPLCKNVLSNIRMKKTGALVLEIFEPIVLVVLMLLCTAFLVDGSFNPFLYFRF